MGLQWALSCQNMLIKPTCDCAAVHVDMGGYILSSANRDTIYVVQEVLWQKAGLASEQMHKSVVAIWHVQRVLAKKRDPLTHVLFIDECLTDDAPLPTEHFWYDCVCIQIRCCLTWVAPVCNTFDTSCGACLQQVTLHQWF